MADVDDSSHLGRLTAQVGWLVLMASSRLALILHSSDKPSNVLGNDDSTVNTDSNTGIIIDRVAGNASVCVRVCLFVDTLLLEPFDLDFWHESRP